VPQNALQNFTQSNLKGRLSYAFVNTITNGVSGWTGTGFSYDTLGRVAGMVECLPIECGNSAYDKHLSYGYDLAGDTTSSSDGAGVATTYTYSAASEITSITSSQSNAANPPALVSNVQNGPTGPLTWALGNGLNGLIQHDSLGRPFHTRVCASAPDVNCSPFVYGVIAYQQGTMVTWTDDSLANASTSYGYDDFGRLSSASIMPWNSAPQNNFSYTYDRYGNRWGQTATSGPNPSYTFNKASNQISNYSYDAAGNMTGDGFHNYLYDAEGNVIDVDGGAARYTYNALNQRVRIDKGTSATEYVFNSSGQRVSIWDGNTHAQLQGQYYWGNRPVAYYSGGAVHFQHQDWLGTERIRTSYNGSVEGTYVSLPFGDGYSPSGPDNDAYHFAQLDRDSETDTQNAQFRQYSSTQGRWMSPDPYSGSYDPSDPQSFNRYSYVGNMPLSFTDPSGLDPEGGSSNPAGGCVGAVVFGGTNPAADAGCVIGFMSNWLRGFFGALGGPSFQGTTKPRPGGTIWDEHGGFHASPYSSIAAMIGDVDGITSSGCEFGACGGSNLLGSAGVVMSHYPFNPQTIVPELIFLNWWRNQTTKTHGLWTHGNWCGAGGSGYPVDGHDTNCMMHDYCYSQHGFSPGTNFDTLSLDQRAQLQGCNRQLCSAEKQLGGWTADQITGYFSIVPSNGNGCWAGPQ
jgi:RHS repeat-associated protein